MDEEIYTALLPDGDRASERCTEFITAVVGANAGDKAYMIGIVLNQSAYTLEPSMIAVLISDLVDLMNEHFPNIAFKGKSNA